MDAGSGRVLVEGDYVETVEGLLFAVKGVHHPQDLTIAYLRYIPDENGDRIRDGVRYRRVYDLEGTEEFLRRRFPRYLNRIEEKSLVLQSVRNDRISRVFRPREKLVEILSSQKTDLDDIIARFASALTEQGISISDLGVSGSVLIGLDKPTSDVDLISYGVEAGRRVYRALADLREEETGIRSYDPESVMRVVDSRWGDTDLNLEALADLETQKMLHGLVEEREYFLRLVKHPGEVEKESISRPLGKVRLRATVVDAEDSIFAPCTYGIEECSYHGNPELPEASQLLSYRGKFTEQARVGDRVEAKGTLEEAVFGERKIHRIMLGGRGDYLVPVELTGDNFF